MYSISAIHKELYAHVQLYLFDSVNDFFMILLMKKENRSSYEFGFIDFAFTAKLFDNEFHAF